MARRYPQNNFFGDTSRACVCDGNFQVEVTGLCMYLSMLLSCIPVLEQPLGSCTPNVPVLRNLFAWFGMIKTVTYMGCFSGPSVKSHSKSGTRLTPWRGCAGRNRTIGTLTVSRHLEAIMEAAQVRVHFARKVRLTLQLWVWQWLNYMAGCVPEFQFDLVMSFIII